MNKKAFTMAEALMRITIAVILLFVVFKFGKSIANSFFGGGDSIKSFESFADELNSQKQWQSEPILLSLDSGTAVVGFSKDGDFECISCQGGEGTFASRAIFKKPSKSQCTGTACVCLCSKGLDISYKDKSAILDKQPASIKCAGLYCKSVNTDIYPSYVLKDGKYKTYGRRSDFASWKNGFIFAREVPGDDPSNDAAMTGYIKNDQRTLSLYLERDKVEGNSYIMACPELPCIVSKDQKTNPQDTKENNHGLFNPEPNTAQ